VRALAAAVLAVVDLSRRVAATRRESHLSARWLADRANGRRR